MQYIQFIGIDFERYLRLKLDFNEFGCVYSVNLSDGIKQFNQQQFCLIILDLLLVSSDTGQEELLRSLRRAHPVPVIALCSNAGDSNVVRLLNAGADQVLDVRTPDEVLAAYAHTLINRYTLLDHMDREPHSRTDLYVGDFEIDLVRRRVLLKGEIVELSRKEFDLLLFFAQNPEHVLTEAQILKGCGKQTKIFTAASPSPSTVCDKK